MTDSPAGLAAWLLNHPGFSKWSYGSDPKQSPTRDDVLDDITLYWVTNTGISAGRLYWENGARAVTVAAAQKTSEIQLPVAITVFPDEVFASPRAGPDAPIRSSPTSTRSTGGGHFAAWEEPELFAQEMRAAFRSLR